MAGFFGLFDYSKPGKGVDKEGPEKKRFFYFFELYFRKFWKIITLNLIYVLFCIPIVTIGPATAALTKVLRDLSNEKGIFLWSDFIEAFRKNFKYGFFAGLLDGLVTGILIFCAYFYYVQSAGKGWAMMIPLALTIGAFVIFSMMKYYWYLMIVTLDMKFLPILKNSFILAILGVKSNICTFFFIGLITVGVAFLGLLAVIPLIVLYAATTQFIAVFNSYQHIEKYIIQPYYEKTGERRPDVYYFDEDDELVDSVFEDIGTKEKPVAAASTKRGKTIK